MRNPTKVKILEMLFSPRSKKPNAIPELKVRYKSIKGRKSLDIP
jgi:hypothetical protein